MGDSSGNGRDTTTSKSIGAQHLWSTDCNASGLNAVSSRTKPDECTSAHTSASVQTFQTSMALPISAHVAATLTESSPLAPFKLPPVESPAPSRMVARFTPSPMVPAFTPSPMVPAFTPSPMAPAFTPSPMVIIPADVEARRRESPVRSNLSVENDMNLEACILADCILADVDADGDEDSDDNAFEAQSLEEAWMRNTTLDVGIAAPALLASSSPIGPHKSCACSCRYSLPVGGAVVTASSHEGSDADSCANGPCESMKLTGFSTLSSRSARESPFLGFYYWVFP